MSLGGTGVTQASLSSAGYFNPALLSIQSQHRDKSFGFANFSLGARLIDRDGFLDSVEHYQNNDYESSFDDLWTRSRALANSGMLDKIDFREVADISALWLNDLNQLTNKPLRVLGNAAVSIGYVYSANASNRKAIKLQHRRYLVGGAIITVPDQDRKTLDQSVNALSAIADIAAGVSNLQQLARAIETERLTMLTEEAIRTGEISNELREFFEFPTVQEFVTASIDIGNLIISTQEYFDFEALLSSFNNDGNNIAAPDLRQYLRYQVPEKIAAAVTFEGADISETAISYAQNIEDIRGLNFGITVKHLHLRTIDFTKLIEEVDSSDLTNELYRKSQHMLNVDLGMLYSFNNKWTLGATIKNIIPQDFTTIANSLIKYRPIARIGVTYTFESLQISADVDLTESEPLGFDPNKQYIGLGLDYTLLNALSLRAGLRSNIVTHTTLPSFGIGYSSRFLSVNLGVAISDKEDEYGAAFDMTLRF